MSLRTLLCITGAFVLNASAVHAQRPADIQLGTRARVWVGGQRAEGTVGLITLDTLRLTSGDVQTSFATKDLERVDIYAGSGHRTRSVVVGGLIGGLIGLGIGALAGQLEDRDCKSFCGLSVVERSSEGLALGVLGGITVGALRPLARWNRVR